MRLAGAELPLRDMIGTDPNRIGMMKPPHLLGVAA
jgi:hypothetical protein